MAEERVERRLAAILCADVVGYSRLMGTDEEKTFAVLQALALRCAIRSQIGVAEFVAYRDDHTGAAGGLCRGFAPARFETAIAAEPRPGFGELAAATAIGHFTTLEPASTRETIDRISGGTAVVVKKDRAAPSMSRRFAMCRAIRDPGVGNRKEPELVHLRQAPCRTMRRRYGE